MTMQSIDQVETSLLIDEGGSGLMSRRTALIGIGFSLLTLAGCDQDTAPRVATPLPRPTAVPSPYTQDQLLGLMVETGALVTDPVLRALLQERVFPLFQGASSVDFAGISVPVIPPYISYSPTVKNPNIGYEGATTPQQKDSELAERGASIPKYQTQSIYTVNAPMGDILTPEENEAYKLQAPEANKVTKGDSTALVYQYQIGGADREVAVSITPVIQSAINPRMNPADVEPTLRLILLKEALTFGFALSMMESMSARMQEFGIEREIDATDSTGAKVRIPLIMPAYRGLNSTQGRAAALPDLFGYLAMGKGVVNIPEYQSTYSKLGYEPLAQEAANIDFTGGTRRMIATTLQWALGSSLVPTLAHIGDLNKIP